MIIEVDQKTLLTEENTPHLRLWRGMKRVMATASSLAAAVSIVRKELILVDSAPRHDTVLDGDMLDRLYKNRYGYTFGVARRALSHSMSTLEEVARTLNHVLRGELKVRIEDRVLRHLEEARNLVELFSQDHNSAEDTKPYLIRQHSLGQLHHYFTDMLDTVTPLRRSFDAATLAEGLFAELNDVESELFKLRANVGRWRDNPSQKMTAKINDCASRVEKIEELSRRLQQNAQFECQELGIKFFNRQGATRVDRC